MKLEMDQGVLEELARGLVGYGFSTPFGVPQGCHEMPGLVAWYFTLAATRPIPFLSYALSVSAGSSERESPRHKPVACAPVSLLHRRGASPRRGPSGVPVAEGNCVVRRQGGEQPEANDQSVVPLGINQAPQTRFGLLPWRACMPKAKPKTLGPAGDAAPRWREPPVSPMVRKRQTAHRTAVGGWRQNGRKVQHDDAGRPGRQTGRYSCAVNPPRAVTRVRRASRTGVRASIVAWKPGNAGGAKGRREVNGR